MVNVWATAATADSITLSNGMTVDLTAIPGNGWPQSKLNKARDFLQDLLDKRTPAADIPIDEETLGWTDQQMQDVYGGRMWWDGDDLMARNVIVNAVMWDGEKLSLALRNP